MGLIARFLEQEGIATTITGWRGGVIRRVLAPRSTYTNLARGATVGNPHDGETQLAVLRDTLALLSQDAPITPMKLDYEA